MCRPGVLNRCVGRGFNFEYFEQWYKIGIKTKIYHLKNDFLSLILIEKRKTFCKFICLPCKISDHPANVEIWLWICLDPLRKFFHIIMPLLEALSLCLVLYLITNGSLYQMPISTKTMTRNLVYLTFGYIIVLLPSRFYIQVGLKKRL